MHQRTAPFRGVKLKKKFWGYAPSPNLSPGGEGDTPSPSAPRLSRLWRERLCSPNLKTLPGPLDSCYDFRHRRHNRLLINKTSHLADSDFIIRMIYKDMYQLFLYYCFHVYCFTIYSAHFIIHAEHVVHSAWILF